jgi:hypothetical protein
VDAEPTGRTIDGQPWAEPRPPHLPDILTRISPWVLPFLVLLALQFWLAWVAQPLATDVVTSVDYWIGAARSNLLGVAVSLLGVALFLRHPNARSRLPQVTSGVLLLSLQVVMALLQPWLDPWFASITPPSDDEFFFTPLAEGYSILTSVVGVFGVAVLARGLSDARRHRDGGPVRSLAIVLAVLVFASLGFNLLELTLAEFEASPMFATTIVGKLLVNLLMRLTLGYLVVVAAAGWIGHESPRSGWGFAALGAGLILLPRLFFPVVSVLPISQELILAVVGLVGEAGLLGWLLLVTAFALGLPFTELFTDEPGPIITGDRPAATRSGSGAG